MPKPGEFFVGLLEFFAILLPGAIAVAVLGPRLGPQVLGPLVPVPGSQAERWAMVLVASYAVGSLLFHIGSGLDPLYDRVRKARYARAKAMRAAAEAERTRADGSATEADAPGTKKDDLPDVLNDAFVNERAFEQATALRHQLLAPAQREAMNTFKWARSVLLARMPAGADDVHRLEADSKFFRSTVVVCVLVGVVFLLEQRWIPGLLAIASAWPAFAVYFDRRMKSTTQAYTHVITLLVGGGTAPTADDATT